MSSTCSRLVLLPVTFTSKSQEALPFLCCLPADRGLFFPTGISHFSASGGWDHRWDSREKAGVC